MMNKLFPVLFCFLVTCAGLQAQQLYNLSLDDWSKEGKVWYPYAAGAQKIWDSGNKGTTTLGINVTLPEEEFVAVKGAGKKAACMKSAFVGVIGIGKFAAGSIYTGSFLKMVGTSGAQLAAGVPFTHRPKALHGYYAYTPGKIDYADKSLSTLKGKMDEGGIEIYLATWTEPFVIDTAKDIALTPKADGVVGYGTLTLNKATDGYVEFTIPVSYTSDATPTYIVIMASSSRWGAHFTGSTQSVLYLDEMDLKY